MDIKSATKSLAVLASLAIGYSGDAKALSLIDSLVAVPGQNFAGLPVASFDTPNQNVFYSEISSYVSTQAYRLSSTFSGGVGTGTGSRLEYSFLGEISAYEFSNSSSLCGPGGCSTLAAGSDVPGVSGSFELDETGQYSFTLSSPGGNYNNDETLNPDLLNHLVFFKVEKDVILSLSWVTSAGGPGTFSIATGGMIAMWEDLQGFIGAGSDRDYNDHILYFKQVGNAEVPEPGTLLLLAAGAPLLFRKRLAKLTSSSSVA